MPETNEREKETKLKNGADGASKMAKNQQEDEGRTDDNVETLETAAKEEKEGEEQEVSDKTSESKEEQEQEDYKKKYFYLAAEMDNMRKRFEREKQNLLKFGNEKVLSDLIEVVDNLDRTLSALDGESDKKIKNIVVGIDMVRKQFLEALKENGLERVDALGKKFDPHFHEAMAQQPAEGEEDETVINEYQKGYILNGRLLRPAKVIVAKNKK